MKITKFLVAKVILTVSYLVSGGVLIFESCLNGPSSANKSNAVGGTIADIINGMGGDQTVEVLPTSLKIDSKISEAKVGEFLTLTTTTLPEDATYQSVDFTSSDTSVATVTSGGYVSFIKAGSVTITANNINYPEIKDTMTVNVSNIEVESITSTINAPLNDGVYTLTVGSSYSVTNVITPDNATIKTVTYEMDENPYVTLSSNGRLTPRESSDGSIIEIKVNCGSISSSLKVMTEVYKVEEIPLTAINTSTSSTSIYVTQSWTPSFTFTPANATDRSYTLSTSDSSVASISGKSVKGVKAGTATITATSTKYPDVKAIINVTVNAQPAVTDFTTTTSLTMTEGTTRTISVSNIKPAYANASSKTYSSDNNSVAKVSTAGKITAVAPGTAHITVKVGSISKAVTVTVVAKPAPEVDKTTDFLIESVANPVVFAGKSINIASFYKVSGFLSGDASYNPPNKSITYSLADPSLGTISGSSLTPKCVGEFTIYITHTASGITKEVTMLALDDFMVDGSKENSSKNIKFSEVFEFEVGKTDDDFIRIDSDSAAESWEVKNSDNSIITVKDNGGKYSVTGVGEGSSTITVVPRYGANVYEDMSKTIHVNVAHVRTTKFEASMTRTRFNGDVVDINPDLENNCYINDKLTLTTSIDDGVTLSNIVYSSSDKDVVAINNNGQMWINGIGKVTITATEAITNRTQEFRLNIQNRISLVEDNPFSVSGVEASYDEKTGLYSIENGHVGKVTLNFAEGTTYKTVKWTTSDEEIATMGGDGTISPLKAGKITLTATVDDGYSTEKVVVTVKLKINKQPVIKDLQQFFLFVRKALGHFGAFLVFGVFSALTYMMWFRGKHWFWSTPLTVIQGFGLAGLTEFIQLHVPGRAGLFSDVIIDTSGCVLGIFITGALIILITLLSWRRKKKKKID